MILARTPIISDSLAAISTIASIAAWQEQFDWGVKVLASLVAIVAGLYSIYLHRQRIKRTGRP